jgi:hypothetical protein
MHHHVSVLGLLLLCACGPVSTNNPDAGNDSGPADAGSDGPPTNGTWTQVVPKDSANVWGKRVTGFYFDSLTDGVVSFQEGLVEHFNAPTMIDKIVLDGSAHNSDQYYGFINGTSLGLVLRNDDGTQLVTSQDKGGTWAYQAAFKSATAPAGVKQNFPMAWTGTDKTGGWHDVITAGLGGDVYSSSGPLGPTTTLTDTWHPSGTVTVPATIPASDCSDWLAVADYPGQQFVATTDGSAFVYTSQTDICHSTDGGKSFVNVTSTLPASFLNAHTYAPLGFLFTSPTVGIGWYGNSLDNPGTAYVIYTSDGGATWTPGTLPAGTQAGGFSCSLRAAFASPTGTIFLVGGDIGLVIFKSADGGKTWTDLSAKISSWATNADANVVRLMNGFAFDDQHLWVGDDSGFIAYSATGGQ